MNRIIFKSVSLVLCSVVAISAQQAEQSLPPPLPQQEPQFQQEQQQIQQVQQPLPPPVQQQVVQQPLPPPPPVQQQVVQLQQTNCPQPLLQPKWGLWAKFNLNSVSYGFNSKKNKEIDMGIGLGGGVVIRIPITNSLDVNPEIGFLHRNLYSKKSDSLDAIGVKHDKLEDESEFVLSIIPVLAQFTPFEFPLYVMAGFQVDFPISAKRTTTFEDKEDTEKFKERAGYDLGVVWGLGYNITERFSFNFRSVVGLRSITGKSADARTPTQYGLGVTFF